MTKINFQIGECYKAILADENNTVVIFKFIGAIDYPIIEIDGIQHNFYTAIPAWTSIEPIECR